MSKRTTYIITVGIVLSLLVVVVVVVATAWLLAVPQSHVVGAQTPLAHRVAAAVSKATLPPSGRALPDSTVAVRDGEATVTYYERVIPSENDLVEEAALADPGVMAAAFRQPQIRSVSVDWQTEFVRQSGELRAVTWDTRLDWTSRTLRGSAVSATWTHAAYAAINLKRLEALIIADPVRFFATASSYAINPAIWRGATDYHKRLPASVP